MMKKSILLLLIFSLSFLWAKEVLKKYNDFIIEEDEVVDADVIVYEGDAIIKGTLKGDLKVYSGDIKITETGVVKGEMECFAGIIDNNGEVKEEKSRYILSRIKNKFYENDEFKDVYRFFDKSFVLDEDNDDLEELKREKTRYYNSLMIVESKDNRFLKLHYNDYLVPKTFIDYSKVGGFYLGAGHIFNDMINDNEVPFDIQLYARGGYQFKLEEWEYHLIESIEFWEHAISLSASQYRTLASEDMWKVRPEINTMAALFIKEDFYNYYTLEGVGFTAGSILDTDTDNFTLAAIGKTSFYHDKVIAIDGNNERRSLFGGDKKFTQNIPVEEGNMKYMRFDGELQAKYKPYNTGIGFAGTYETTLDDLDQKYDYEKLIGKAVLRTGFLKYFNIINNFRIESISNNAPSFKYIAIGGTGTLPGYSWNEFSGNRGFVNRTILEIISSKHFDVPTAGLSFIFDMGDAWSTDTDDLYEGFDHMSIRNLKSSFGIGLNLNGTIMFSVHKRLDRSEDAYQAQLGVVMNLDNFSTIKSSEFITDIEP